jgi:protein tyrosine phosphatase (PTP) superfamily phosphohydrolase (DUF442 family)
MNKVMDAARKGFHILKDRLKNQGLYTTLVWVYGRGVPRLTGVPVMRYCRVTPQVYVGSQYMNGDGKRRLEQEGINAVVNMRVEFDDAVAGLTLDHYCHIPTVDDDAPTMQALARGVNFIHRVIEQGGKVYIHCAGGVGRAPTMAAAYFITQGMNVEGALDLIKKARPFINITPVQLQRLKDWSQEWQK